MESSRVLQTTHFAYRKGLGTCDAHLCESYRLQSPLEIWQEARIVQIDFIAEFDEVNHQEILNKLCSVGSGDSVLSILMQFVLNRVNLLRLRQECRKAVFWASYCPSCTPQCFFCHTGE